MLNVTGNGVSLISETTSRRPCTSAENDAATLCGGCSGPAGTPSATCPHVAAPSSLTDMSTASHPRRTALPSAKTSPPPHPPRAHTAHATSRTGAAGVVLPPMARAPAAPRMQPPLEASAPIAVAPQPGQRLPLPTPDASAAAGASTHRRANAPPSMSGGGGDHSQSHSSSHSSNSSGSTSGRRSSGLLATGLHGLCVYMTNFFSSPQHNGFNMYPPTYQSEYRPVPRSPRPQATPPLSRRANSDIVFEAERQQRALAQVGGIPVGVQHRLLRRLRYTPLTCRSTSNPCTPVSRAPSLAKPVTASAVAPTYPAHPTEGPCGSPAMGGQLHNWIDSLEPSASSAVPFPATSQTCSVCLRYFREEDVAELPCGHLYHFACIVQWLQRQGSCPFCRANVRDLAAHRDSAEAAAAGAKVATQPRAVETLAAGR